MKNLRQLNVMKKHEQYQNDQYIVKREILDQKIKVEKWVLNLCFLLFNSGKTYVISLNREKSGLLIDVLNM